MDAKYPQVEKEIIARRELTNENKAALNKAIAEFNETFQGSKAQAKA